MCSLTLNAQYFQTFSLFGKVTKIFLYYLSDYLLSEHFCKPPVRMREVCLFFVAKSIFLVELLELSEMNLIFINHIKALLFVM